MHVGSSGETVLVQDGVVEVAFDLSESDAGYLVISRPEGGQDADGFFGADHYVEVKDQLFGIYGGLELLKVPNDRTLVIRLARDVPGVGRELSIATAEPMSGELLSYLHQLERV